MEHRGADGASPPQEETVVDLSRFLSRDSERDHFQHSTIHRVPPEIQRNDDNAYRPKAVCIGLYSYTFRQSQGLGSMQDHKYACVSKLASKYGKTENFFDISRIRMKDLGERVRRSYSGEVFSRLETEELAEMLVLDGCFILNLLLKHRDSSNEEEIDEDDWRRVIGRLWIWELAKYDLLLLENQIPFFVIQELYEILKTKDDDGINLVDCAHRYFKSLDLWKKELLSSSSPPFMPYRTPHHLLHLTYNLFIQHSHWGKSSWPKPSQQWIPSATELQAAGVKFKEREHACSFLDITFSNGVMEIPHLEVHDYSESLFRNLIAFEQTYPYHDFLVTAYAAFMNCLVDTQNDLRLLQLKGILTFRMTGDKDTVNFFSRLCNDVHYPADINYLNGVYWDVTAYKDLKFHKWRADLRLNYFSSPWSTIVVVAATLTFLLTFMQAFFTVLSYF